LIICDLQLPILSGYEVADALKQDPALRDIPLVAVTAFAMVGDRDRILRAGFDGYLPKPIEPETFASQIEAFLAPGSSTAKEPMNTPSVPHFHTGKVAGHRVLVVDNDPVNLELAVSLLQASGYEVVTAQDPEEGIDLARTRKPALIVSDVCMGKASGFDFLQRVKTDPALREIPFVFLTSTAASSRERAHGMELGAVRYLIRPIEPERLLAEIAACLQANA
jgi:two-component system cell cycle response regulator